MTKAIFYDRNCDLMRCQFAGINEKGEPNWLIIEQGKSSMTLAEKEKLDDCDYHYKLLCLEGEEVSSSVLMRILCSFIRGQVEGWSDLSKDFDDLIDGMKMHQVKWYKGRITLRFHIGQSIEHEGCYYLSIYQEFGGVFLGSMDNITDPDNLLEVLDNFCCLLEDMLKIESVYKIVSISAAGDYPFSENLLSRFDRVITKNV